MPIITSAFLNTKASERAFIKGKEIVKIGSVAKHRRQRNSFDGYVNVLDIKLIEGGVEVLVKAWNKNNKRIGFGKDGSVEIERLRIMNPPIMTRDDILGDYERRSLHPDGTESVRKYREDPKEALLSHIARVLSGKILHDDSRIVSGKVGSTTTTANPDAHTESTSVDGRVGRDPVNQTWADIRSGAGNSSNDDTADISAFTRSTTTTDQYETLFRSIMGFDVSSITDTDNVDSATIILLGTFESDAYSLTGCNIGGATPASNTAIVDADYGNVGTTEFSAAKTFTDWNNAGDNTFTLNASGLSNISLTVTSNFSFQLQNDISNSLPTWSVTPNDAGMQAQDADAAGTDDDPLLTVEHSAASTHRFGGPSGAGMSGLRMF